MNKKTRIKAYRKGLRAEWLCAFSLLLKGYRIVGRRFKTPVGEVDLIARKRDVIVFIEVKARPNTNTALESISLTAQRRISSSAEWWISQQTDGASLSWRFDVMAVIPLRWPKHFENVW